MGGPPSPWTDALMETLRQLWSAGVSASLIARELGHGITRNAVLGKAMREGLGAHKLARMGKPGPKRQRKRRKPVIRVVNVATVLPDEPPKAPEMRQLQIYELANHHCRWPVGDPQNGDFFFCAADRHDGAVYCPWHMKTAKQQRRTI